MSASLYLEHYLVIFNVVLWNNKIIKLFIIETAIQKLKTMNISTRPDLNKMWNNCSSLRDVICEWSLKSKKESQL